MRPQFDLDETVLRRNARSWQAHAGVPIRVVVKSDGYGWGLDRIVSAVDDVVDGYHVSAGDEFARLRPLTSKPIATLNDVPLDEIAEVLDAGGIPTISSLDGIEAAGCWGEARGMSARIRFGIRPAVGWSGVEAEDVARYAVELARRRIAIECWTHLTDPSLQTEQVRAFEHAVGILIRAGVRVVATDTASSVPLAAGVSRATQARLGVALFGFHFGADVEVVSALRVRAPIVSVEPACGQRVGYGLQRAPERGFLVVVRCGYGDGFPRFRNAAAGLLAIGMQFATCHLPAMPASDALDLIDASTDLDSLLTGTNVIPHELVVALGRASRAAA